MAKSGKGDGFNAVSQYLQGKEILLTADQENMLDRWTICDGWLRQNKLTTDEVVTKLMAEFGVSRWTAMQDIRQTQKLFATTRLVNKKYLGHLQLERINQDIEKTRDLLFWKDGPVEGTRVSRMPDAKELASLAKLYEAYNHILERMPDNEKGDTMPPPVFNFIPVAGGITVTMNLEQTLDAADLMLKGGEYIDHEMLPDDPDQK